MGKCRTAGLRRESRNKTPRPPPDARNTTIAPQSRYRLITHFGTVVFVEPLTSQLRHGPLASSPANLALRGDGRTGALIHDPGGPGGEMPVTLFVDGGLASAPAQPNGSRLAGGLTVGAQPLRIEGGADGPVGLLSGGLYAAAEPDGRITLSRTQRRQWETFLPLPDPAFGFLRALMSQSWVAQARRQLIEPAAMRVAENFHVQLGELRVDLRALAKPDSPMVRADVDTAHSIDILYDGWKLERLFRYRPLIYLTAFGKDGVFECLELALASLDRFARWPGSVLLLTDRDPDRLAAMIPETMRPRFSVHRCNPPDMLGFTLARYALGAIPVARLAQPLLYADTDIVFDSDLTPLMIDILLSGQACFMPEREMFDYDFYGEPLFRADGNFQPTTLRGLCSGAIGLPSVATVADNFTMIAAAAETYAADKGNRNLFGCYDQPFANYVFHKLGGFDTTVMPRRSALRHSSCADVKDRRGFVHFSGGVGVSGPKLVRMAQYFDDLAQLAAKA